MLVEKNEVRGASLSGAQPSLCGRQQANPLPQPLAATIPLSVSEFDSFFFFFKDSTYK